MRSAPIIVSGTTLLYNGVLLRDCETKSFYQTIEYDPSGTDVMFSRFRIGVESTLIAFVDGFQGEHPIQITSLSGRLAESAPAQIRELYRRLQKSRGDFYFFIADAPSPGSVVGTTLNDSPDMMVVAAGYEYDGDQFQINPLDQTQPIFVDASTVIDCDNGPKPKSCNVQQIFGGRSMRVSFEIEVCRRLCSQGDDPVPPGVSASELQASAGKIMSNRWAITENRGEDWKMTRTIDGTLRVSDKSVSPHLMRYFVVPTLPRRFRRVSQNFATDPTDLVLKYQIQDQEAEEAPPPPAIKWSGHFAESGSGANAAKQHSELQLRLEGPPGVNKQDLISAAGYVVKSRIAGLSVLAGAEAAKNRPILLNTSIVEVIGEPIIEMRVRVDSTAIETKLATRIKQIGNPMQIDGYHPDVWPTPSPFTKESLAGQFACYLQEPCSVWHSVPQPAFNKPAAGYVGDEPLKDNPYDENADGVVDATDTEDRAERLNFPNEPVLYASNEPFPDDVVAVAAAQFVDEPYTYIRISSEYVNDAGIVQLPYADGDRAATDPTCSLFKLHSGLCRRIFRMEATRRDKPPVLPKPNETITDPNGITERLDENQVVLVAPEFGADGISRKFRVQAVFTYAMSRPPTTSEKLRLAISPIDGTSGELRYINGADLFSDTAIEWNQP